MTTPIARVSVSRSAGTGGRSGGLTCCSCFAKSAASSWPGLLCICCCWCMRLAPDRIHTLDSWTGVRNPFVVSSERRRLDFPSAARRYVVRFGAARDRAPHSGTPRPCSRGSCWALRGMVRRVGGRRLGGHVMSTSAPHRRSARAVPVAAVQRRGHGGRARSARPAVPVRLAFPLGLLDAPDHAHLLAVVHNPLTKLVLFGVCVLGPVPLGAPFHGSRSSTGCNWAGSTV